MRPRLLRGGTGTVAVPPAQACGSVRACSKSRAGSKDSRKASKAAADGEEPPPEQQRPPPFQTPSARRARAVVNHDCIGQSSLFAGRDEAFLRRLKDEMYVKVFQAGEYIMREGEQGRTLYYMHRGEVRVLVSPSEHLVATLGDGSLFGELALLGVNNRRTATIRAVDFCDCRVIDQRGFLKALQAFPKERAWFQQLADRRLRELEEKRREQEEEPEQKAASRGDAVPSELRRSSTSILEGVFQRLPACSKLQRRRRASETVPQGLATSEASPEFPLRGISRLGARLPDVSTWSRGARGAASDGGRGLGGRPCLPDVPPAVAQTRRSRCFLQVDAGEATRCPTATDVDTGRAGAGARAAHETDREDVDVLRRALTLVPLASSEPLVAPSGRQPKAERHRIWSRRFSQVSPREPRRGPHRSHGPYRSQEAPAGANDE